MTGIDVPKRTESLFVAAHKGGTGAGFVGRLENRSIELKAKFDHCIGEVDVMFREHLGAYLAKGSAHRRRNFLVSLLAIDTLEQCEQNLVGADAQEIVEIPVPSPSIIDGRQAGIPELGKVGLDQLTMGLRFAPVKME